MSVSKPVAPPWNLSTVLEALSQQPFEMLENVGMKYLSLKTSLLVALTSSKRVSERHSLSVHHSCLLFVPGFTKITLLPNPTFMTKVSDSYNCLTLKLMAFHLPPFSSAEEERRHCLCPVRALHMYLDRKRALRKSDQLFVS